MTRVEQRDGTRATGALACRSQRVSIAIASPYHARENDHQIAKMIPEKIPGSTSLVDSDPCRLKSKMRRNLHTFGFVIRPTASNL